MYQLKTGNCHCNNAKSTKQDEKKALHYLLTSQERTG
jgi:hypothetical protein